MLPSAEMKLLKYQTTPLNKVLQSEHFYTLHFLGFFLHLGVSYFLFCRILNTLGSISIDFWLKKTENDSSFSIKWCLDGGYGFKVEKIDIWNFRGFIKLKWLLTTLMWFKSFLLFREVVGYLIN